MARVCHHLEVLRRVRRRRVRVGLIKGVHHTHALYRLLSDAIDHYGRWDTGRFEDRRHDVYEMMELVTDTTPILDGLGPSDDCALPDSLKWDAICLVQENGVSNAQVHGTAMCG